MAFSDGTKWQGLSYVLGTEVDLMDPKTRQEMREYQRGYETGKQGERFDNGSQPLVALFTLGLCGGARENTDAYRDGFKDGREDRKR